MILKLLLRLRLYILIGKYVLDLKKGGVLNLVRRLVELNCNANNIPEKLEFDLVIFRNWRCYKN